MAIGPSVWATKKKEERETGIQDVVESGVYCAIPAIFLSISPFDKDPGNNTNSAKQSGETLK